MPALSFHRLAREVEEHEHGSINQPIGTLAIFVFPGLGAVGLACMVPMGIYEVGPGIWLLVRGLKV